MLMSRRLKCGGCMYLCQWYVRQVVVMRFSLVNWFNTQGRAKLEVPNMKAGKQGCYEMLSQPSSVRSSPASYADFPAQVSSLHTPCSMIIT
jgi:hypothetical protein